MWCRAITSDATSKLKYMTAKLSTYSSKIDLRNYCRAHGLKLKMIPQIVASLKAKEANAKPRKPQPMYPRITVAIDDSALASEAASSARRANGRIQNWTAPRASSVVVPLGDYDTINLGQYSRSCKYTHYKYAPCYTSYGIIAVAGAALLYRHGFAGAIKSRFLRAPAGMRWTKKDGLCLIRESDGMDYHPTTADLQARDFSRRCRAAMSANYTARLNAKREAKRTTRWERQFTRDLATTRVTLHDSRRAGNCIEGSLRFAERKLGIAREAIIAGGHLFTVPAKRLLALANGETDRAMAAVRAAWTRETTVCI